MYFITFHCISINKKWILFFPIFNILFLKMKSESRLPSIDILYICNHCTLQLTPTALVQFNSKQKKENLNPSIKLNIFELHLMHFVRKMVDERERERNHLQFEINNARTVWQSLEAAFMIFKNKKKRSRKTISTRFSIDCWHSIFC